MSDLPNEPISRVEQYLSNIAGQETPLPENPLSRVEQYLAAIAEQGGGLPPVTDADDGKFMRVVDGEWAAAEVETKPMTVTYDDDTTETFNIFVESTTE